MESMTRRGFVKLSAAAAFSAMVLPSLSCSISEAREPEYEPKKDAFNVLFISTDDMNDWIGHLGTYPGIKTPHIDKLAEKGMSFTNAHASAPRCCPSRTSVLTGLAPSTTGVYENNQPFRVGLPDAVTLPQHFWNHGYSVAGAGKMFHTGYPDPESWQEYYPSKFNHMPQDPLPEDPKYSDKGVRTKYFDWDALDVSDDEMGDGKVANWIVGKLGSKLKEPFFLSVGFRKPHGPWHVPKKYFEMYPPESITLPQTREDDLEDVPEAADEIASDFRHQGITDAGQLRNAIQGYLASVSFVDAMIGRVLDALYSSPYAENTIIVLWSDHGYHLGEKQCWSKGTLWEETTRVPFIVSVPGLTEPGTRCSRPVSLLDIYPTLVDLCDLTAREELEGTSIRPLLQDPDTLWERPAITTLRRDAHSARSERWRYIRYQDGSEELYDHENDEHEWTNLASDVQYESVKEELARWLPEVSAPDAPRRSLRDKVENRIKGMIYGIDMDQD